VALKLTCLINKSPQSLNVTTLSASDTDRRTAIEGLHVTAFGSDFVSLAWISPEGIDADLYQVRCRSERAAVDEVAYTVRPNITVRSLQPHSTYSFAVSLSSVFYCVVCCEICICRMFVFCRETYWTMDVNLLKPEVLVGHPSPHLPYRWCTHITCWRKTGIPDPRPSGGGRI